MLNTPHALRAATRKDARHLAKLVNYAGEGLPLHYWQSLARADENPWAIGTERASRENGAFSYTNTVIATFDGKVAGALIAYAINEVASPGDYAAMPPMFRPIQTLEDLAVGTHYVSVLAIYPGFRGRGLGSHLLKRAEEQGGGATMSIVVSDGNPGARRLYERTGYRFKASRAMVKNGWDNAGNNWQLLLKRG